MEPLKLSICVPCYEMGGRGAYFLDRLLESVKRQIVGDAIYEVIVSDHSVDDSIKDVVTKFEKVVPVKYFRYEENRGIGGANLNNAIKQSEGNYIKPLFQDDFFSSPESINIIYNTLVKNNGKRSWLVHSYVHYDETKKEFFNFRTPSYTDRIIMGENTVGPPSVVVFVKDENYFDEKLIWFMDIDFYYRMNEKYGTPQILATKALIGNGLWDGQVTKTMITDELIQEETQYIQQKYKK